MAHLQNLILIGVTVYLVFGANAESPPSYSEETKECSEDQFKCADGNGCTQLAYRCDGDKDCSDGSDDSADICKDDCLGLEDRFLCGDGTCIKSHNVCSGTPQCPDGSDEDENLCSNCNNGEDRFKCAGSTRCIPGGYICDSDLDCGEDDPSDEDPKTCDENCGGKEDRLQCANKKCVYNARACNGKDDCGDGSDESDERCNNCNGDDTKTKCKLSGKCYSPSDRCDGYRDCDIKNDNYEVVTEDGADEENCPASEAEDEPFPVTDVPVVLDDVAPPAEE